MKKKPKGDKRTTIAEKTKRKKSKRYEFSSLQLKTRVFRKAELVF